MTDVQTEQGDSVARVLGGNTDAQVWAREFVKVVEAIPAIPTDEGTMIGWFANAIMAGYDEGQAAERKRSFDERVTEIAFQAGGAAIGEAMVDHPDYVMPSQRVSECVQRVLTDNGVEIPENYR